MTTFAALATAFTSALASEYGDQLDSVFDYFWSADDVTEDSCANVGIVTKGVPSQELKDYVAELITWAKGVYSKPFHVTCFSAHEYLTIAEELDIGRFYWRNGNKSDLSVSSPVVIWYDGAECHMF